LKPLKLSGVMHDSVKAAQLGVAAIWVDCPCGESIANPSNGSLMWGPEDVHAAGSVAVCGACGQALTINARVWQVSNRKGGK
jgi:hypothetical protein